MSRLARIFGAATLCVALLSAAARAQSQAPPAIPGSGVDVSVYGGWDFPTLDLADAADSGPLVGVTVKPRLHEQVTLRFEGNASFLGSAEFPTGIEGPSIQLYRALAGVEVNLFDPRLTKWRFLVNGGVGWSFLSSDDLPRTRFTEGGTDGIDTDGFLVGVGAKVAYPVGESVLLYFGGDGYFHDISGDEDTRRLQLLNRPELSQWSPSWSIPLSLGVRFSLN